VLQSKYTAATEAVNYLKRGKDYEVDNKARRTVLTDQGYTTLCDLLGVSDLYAGDTKWAVFVNPALNAKECYIRDRDYIVNERGEVVIVDEFTGRVMEGRRWNGGLHQAMEAKENCKVQPEQQTAASITYQSLFLLYDTLAGMTGTAVTEAQEFSATFPGLDVVQIPTAKPVKRKDLPDEVFATKLAKFRAILRRVAEYYSNQRPVLVGTTTVEDSALISELLDNEGIPHRVLNAKPEVAERESEIIAQAGRLGAVTIATNMAGRGTDILLGGNAALFAKIYAKQILSPLLGLEHPQLKIDYPAPIPEQAAQDLERISKEFVVPSLFAVGEEPTRVAKLTAIDEFIATAAARAGRTQDKNKDDIALIFGLAMRQVEDAFLHVTQAEKQQVIELGGLVVMGTERHESRRIDLQLRGRSGRQGDPGESIFAISLEDKMFNVFGADKLGQLRGAFEFAGDLDEPLSSNLLTKSLTTIQEKVENFYRDIRGNLFKYDKIIDAQRRRFYLRRQNVLRASRPELEQLATQYCVDTARDVLANATIALGGPKAINSGIELIQAATSQLQLLFPMAASTLDARIAEFITTQAGGSSFNLGQVEDLLVAATTDAVNHQLKQIDAKDHQDEDLAASVVRFLILREFDRNWKAHIQDLELLRDAIGFQSFSQKDPYQEWTVQSNEAFNRLSANIYRFAAISFLTLDPERNLVQSTQPPPPLVRPVEAAQILQEEEEAQLQTASSTVTTNARHSNADAPNRATRRAKKSTKSRRRK